MSRVALLPFFCWFRPPLQMRHDLRNLGSFHQRPNTEIPRLVNGYEQLPAFIPQQSQVVKENDSTIDHFLDDAADPTRTLTRIDGGIPIRESCQIQLRKRPWLCGRDCLGYNTIQPGSAHG